MECSGYGWRYTYLKYQNGQNRLVYQLQIWNDGKISKNNNQMGFFDFFFFQRDLKITGIIGEMSD
jgi:hypothetical protein